MPKAPSHRRPCQEKQIEKYGKHWEDNYNLYKSKHNPIKNEFDFDFTSAAEESFKVDKKARTAFYGTRKDIIEKNDSVSNNEKSLVDFDELSDYPESPLEEIPNNYNNSTNFKDDFDEDINNEDEFVDYYKNSNNAFTFDDTIRKNEFQYNNDEGGLLRSELFDKEGNSIIEPNWPINCKHAKTDPITWIVLGCHKDR